MHLCEYLPTWPYISLIACSNTLEIESENIRELIEIMEKIETESESIKFIYRIDPIGYYAP